MSASRQRRQVQRRSSLDNDTRAIIPHSKSSGTSVVISGIDLRTLPQKIEDLKQEIRETDVIQTLPFHSHLS